MTTLVDNSDVSITTRHTVMHAVDLTASDAPQPNLSTPLLPQAKNSAWLRGNLNMLISRTICGPYPISPPLSYTYLIGEQLWDAVPLKNRQHDMCGPLVPTTERVQPSQKLSTQPWRDWWEAGRGLWTIDALCVCVSLCMYTGERHSVFYVNFSVFWVSIISVLMSVIISLWLGVSVSVSVCLCLRLRFSAHHYWLLCAHHPSHLQQARAEQEEEFISNTLFKKIQALQKEKETLAVNYEKEEEFLTNDLSRKLMQVSQTFFFFFF